MTMRRFIEFLKQSSPFLLLLLGFYLDGILKYHLTFLNTNNNNGLPQLLLMIFVAMAFRMKENRELLIYSFIFGIFYDIYYMGIFGIHTVLFPLTVYIVLLVKDLVPDTFLFEFATYVISLILIHSVIFIFGSVFRSVSFNFIDFITFVMWPTLFFNVLMFIVLYIPVTFSVDKMINLRKEVL